MTNVDGAASGVRPARQLADDPRVERVAQVGWIARGVIYVIAGILASTIATASFGGGSSSGEDASPSGALEEIRQHTGGAVVLVVLTVGLLLFAAWQLLTALLPGDDGASGLAKRAGRVGTALVYVGLSVLAFRLITQPSSSDSDRSAKSLSGRLLEHTGGRWLLAAIGLAILAVGIFRATGGTVRRGSDDLDESAMGDGEARIARTLGVIGEVGRGIALSAVGIFVVQAAIGFDPDEAAGLDEALRRVAEHGWGRLLVGIVAIGFLAYGVYCLATFRHRRLTGPE